MGGVRFPCRPTTHNDKVWRGEPLRAKTCQCGSQQHLDEQGLCEVCGYWSEQTVNETWRRQAAVTGERMMV